MMQLKDTKDATAIIQAAVATTFDLDKLRSPEPTQWRGPYEVPETRAERTFRAAHLALYLALCEGTSAAEAASHVLLHDLPRLYPELESKSDQAERASELRQTSPAYDPTALLQRTIWPTYQLASTEIKEISHDARLLAQLFSLREKECGSAPDLVSRYSDIQSQLVTSAAQQLASDALARSPLDYLLGLDSNPALARIEDYFYEIGLLRLTPRSGWHFIHRRPESVAEHAVRAAQLALLLNEAWGAMDPDCTNVDPRDVAAHLLVHDNPEVRGGDPNSVAKKYVQIDEKRIISDQTQGLGPLGALVANMWHKVEEPTTPLGVCGKDCDRLEMVVTARSLIASGIPGAARWATSTQALIKSNTGRATFEEISKYANTDPQLG
jgi:putative hydrolase of HD superfamily